MKRFLLAGALLLAVATLGPITRFVEFWARCAKRRHQEAMIYLAYERELITKAEIDRMLKQVDEFDGSCLSVIAERKRQCRQQHGEEERRKSTRAILSDSYEEWVIDQKEVREFRRRICIAAGIVMVIVAGTMGVTWYFHREVLPPCSEALLSGPPHERGCRG